MRRPYLYQMGVGGRVVGADVYLVGFEGVERFSEVFRH